MYTLSSKGRYRCVPPSFSLEIGLVYQLPWVRCLKEEKKWFPFFYGQASGNDFSNQLFVLELLPCGSLNGRQRGGIASLASYCNWYTKVIASVFFPTLGNHRFVEILPHNSTVGEACGSFPFHRVLPAWKFPMHERETPSESFRFKWLFKVKNVRFLKFRG